MSSVALCLKRRSAINPDSHLFVVNNTIVNDKGSGTAVMVGATVTTPVIVRNNVSAGANLNQGWILSLAHQPDCSTRRAPYFLQRVLATLTA